MNHLRRRLEGGGVQIGQVFLGGREGQHRVTREYHVKRGADQTHSRCGTDGPERGPHHISRRAYGAGHTPVGLSQCHQRRADLEHELEEGAHAAHVVDDPDDENEAHPGKDRRRPVRPQTADRAEAAEAPDDRRARPQLAAEPLHIDADAVDVSPGAPLAVAVLSVKVAVGSPMTMVRVKSPQ